MRKLKKRDIWVLAIICAAVLILIACIAAIFGEQVQKGVCNPGDTKDCGIGEGICKAGAMACNEKGLWGKCLDSEGKEARATGEAEICGNLLDDDCDGTADEGCGKCVDEDKDGFLGYDKDSCPEGNDCDDSNKETYPKAREVCMNNIDDDCDKETDEGCDCADKDGDGYPLYSTVECQTGTDCDDTKSAVNPGMKEVCNNLIDDDCDPLTGDECRCADSDANEEPDYIKGTCTIGSEEFTDACRDGTKVEEYVCEKETCKQTLVTCKTSCAEGRCVKGEVDLRIKVDTKGKPPGTDDIVVRFGLVSGKFDSLGLLKAIAEKDELLYGKEKETIGTSAADKQTFYDLTVKSPSSNTPYDRVSFIVPNIQNATKLEATEKIEYASYSMRVTTADVSDAKKDQTKSLILTSGAVPVVYIESKEGDEWLMLPDGTKTGRVWIAKGLVDTGKNMYDIFYYNNFERDERYYGSFDASKAGEKVAGINYGKTTGDVITIVSEGVKDVYS